MNLHRWGAVTLFHGLPSDRVNAIAEDAAGLMWFGTDNGLVRYDGRNVEAVAGETALPSRRILALKLDARGGLWIGTEAGAARWRDGRIEVIEDTRGRSVTGIAVSSAGEVGLVTAQGEIIRYREQNDGRIRSESAAAVRLVATRFDPNSHPVLKSPNQTNEVLPLTAIAPTANGQWFIGSGGRSVLVNQGSEVREATSRPPRPYFLAAVFVDEGRVWLGEQGNRQAGGLWLLKGDAPMRQSVETGGVTAIGGGGDELWVGSSQRGVFLLKPQAGDAGLIEHLTFENTAGGLRSNTISAVFRDREGIVWFGTDRGVCRYDRESFRATTVSANRQSNYVRSLLQTRGGEVWSGTNRGLFKLTESGGSAAALEVTELQTRSVYDLFEDGAESVWAATSSGLFVKRKASAGFVRVAAQPETSISIENDSAAAPEQTSTPEPAENNSPENPQSTIHNPQFRESVRAVAGFRGHLYAAFFERGIERIDEDKRIPILTDAAAQQAICLTAEAEQALWFGTAKGELWRYDGAQTRRVDLPATAAERAVRAVVFAGKRLWLGTSQGLLVREGEALREVIGGVDVRDLLALTDSAGRETVWCATQNSGLIKLLPDENVSIRFDTEQGLASQQVFALAAQADSATGGIWIGTNRGVVHHRPSAAEPKLAVKRLVADRIYLPEDLTAELALPHTLHNFLLEVTGLGSKTFPSQFQYEFTLQTRRGKELKKIQTRDPQFAVGDLQSGGYLITARSISRDLVYSAPLTMRLRIQSAPFPWGTLLLASLLAVAVAAAVWAFRQQLRLGKTNRVLESTNAELHETRLRLANETEAERSRIARDLHDQTLADLRHLLVLTDQLPAQPVGLEDNAAAPSPVVIRREIESVSKEIRRICEDLSPSALENIGFLPALEWALSDAVAHLPAEEKFAYEFLCESDLEDRLQLSQIEQIQLYRIVQEALNNICRHAQAKQVRLTVRAESGDLVIEICDDGKGLAEAVAKKTGHGLANIRSRANLIGAQVSWQDAQPGCRFEVRKARVVT
ncbi:MAG TPA: two-component regulator propeller domain-containing protein [Blastocatellia bacterium]|nr:two-component regulator propeller domain-containing protein [Blastocatellia bacterium]HMX25174.1 two-component regulator propeller domain-containing protein [Blastocatellia bacterium]HMZ19246.1 two-component regulator propeller domain-containing protein [Blastocatellia bacterium]